MKGMNFWIGISKVSETGHEEEIHSSCPFTIVTPAIHKY
jgi:hypothetical protein